MPKQIRRFAPALLLALGACGFLGDEPATDAAGDSVTVAVASGDSAATPPTVAADADSVPAATATVATGPVDSTVAAGPAADSTDSAPTAAVDGEAGPSAQVTAGGENASQDSTAGAARDLLASLEARIDALLIGQQEVVRRLDSIGARAAQPDSARSLANSGQVLGEASRSVQSFGVGIVWSIIVLLLFNLVIRGTVWLLDTLAERNAARRLFFKRLVPIVRIVLWVFAAYLIVRVIFQIDAQGIFAAAAAVGVAVGFAAQDLLKNLFGGIILVFDQPFQVGDKVSVAGTYGEVVSIGLRSTRIVTPDDNLVSVPNAQVVDQQVANANAGELNCQVVTDLYLPGWADEEAAKRIAFDAAASSKYVYLNKPIVVLVSDQFKETFLTRVRVKAYVLDPRLEFLFQSDVTERARAGFREAGLLQPRHMRPYLVDLSAAGDPHE